MTFSKRSALCTLVNDICRKTGVFGNEWYSTAMRSPAYILFVKVTRAISRMILSEASLSLAYHGTRISEDLSWQTTYPEIMPHPEPRSSNLGKRHDK